MHLARVILLMATLGYIAWWLYLTLAGLNDPWFWPAGFCLLAGYIFESKTREEEEDDMGR